MQKPLVLELQQLASNSNVDLSDLLHNTLSVAAKLGRDDLKKWANSELHGYKGDARFNLPAYRHVRGELAIYHPELGTVAFRAIPQDLYEEIVPINITESVSSLKHLILHETTPNVVYDFSPDQEKLFRSLPVEALRRYRVTRLVGKNRIYGLLDSVRTTILEWALTLEKEGVLGEGLFFSNEEKEVVKNINIQNFQGVLGNVEAGASVTQTNSLQIKASDFSTLSHYLSENGVNDDDVSDLKHALEEDPYPQSIQSLGPKVSKWASNMIMKAASGSWNVGIAAAGGLIADALGKYYGLK
ncbi:hypothetical protein G5S34_03960 [Herbaspirillum frisingense]|uniref:AbiTii domain-containing protein n=1 Tax=Herbaspirillum frisingense TaxID=92645 RepID=UPI001603F9BE|nr:hypothetical protein [Herbaspirillum frisingense]QNB06018.1 hypothetical protein G5S34_03960 [Herbaspirillum frisingense]